ncbi:MAG: S26 family signal peptidase [Candidatus Thermoplasmatota archaeon]|nr:S26 family signal peptidase [Candidatus Thermoplasmatota archaeon]
MSKKSEAMALVQDVVVALIVVAIVLGSLYIYGGRWPPMVVVESESMQHDDELSFIGVIDTGDLTLVRTLDNAGPPVTWVEGRDTDYRRYGEFGDVIIYHKNGQTQTTPIIHRAIVRIEYNETPGDDGGFDVPTLDIWGRTDKIEIEDFNSYHNGRRETITLVIDVKVILDNFKKNDDADPHGGIITKGDHNREVDQYSLPAWTGPGAPPERVSRLVEPVEEDWIVGVARGEIPWFGLIKLWARGQTENHPAPLNSGPNLMISVALLLVAPFLAESTIIEYRNLHPKEEKQEQGRRGRRGGGGEEERIGPISFIVRTLRNAFTGKVDD